ncbi:MAG: NADH-quinone oxidoreductase subunit C [Ignavibacteria bacterium]|nr:NADH-quinone oxidoreductase subunit C [Ignavibacteria bacterium]
MTPQEILGLLQEKFADQSFELKENISEQILIVPASILKEACYFLKDDERLSFDSLMNLSGVDLADGEKKTFEDGSFEYVGGNLASVYHLHSINRDHKLTLKVIVPKDNPRIPTVEKIWRTADYHEREAFDLFGIVYEGHHNLIRILLPYDWEGYPLRKDYKVPEFYQGMKVPY